MDSEILTNNRQPSIGQRLLPAVVPVLLIAIGYVDPGKWAVAIEGGALFGSDLVLPMLVFNFAAILCQYLSAHIALVTGRGLSQICSEEYDKATCMFLGVLTELSMIALDLTTILGTAHGLNLIFGVDLFTCVFLTATDAVLFPVFATLLDNGKGKFLCISMASFILLFYVLGVLFSQPEISVSTNGLLTKLTGESAFMLMCLLGASIIPHNFYLHSSIVQVFRSSMVPFAVLVVLFVSTHIIPFTWNLGRQAVLRDFFRLDFPGWLHHSTIRIVTIIPALYVTWNSGAEGIYRLLICTQVVVALVLPSSVIPLFRVASSRSLMGIYKIPQFVEFLALITFFGMLGLKIIFLVEMIFGNSDWASSLRWNVGSSMSVSYFFLLVTASTSLFLMLRLAATPLKSASLRDAQLSNWDVKVKDAALESSYVEKNEIDFSETRYDRVESIAQEPAIAPVRSLESHSNMSITSSHVDLTKTPLVSDKMPHLLTIEENGCSILQTESTDFVEKKDRVEGGLMTGKEEERKSWEPEESFKGVSGGIPSLTSEGPGSYRSLGGKSDDSGSGAGSLSRLAGLGRAARRQLAAVLDEFWGQFFDFHGQATQEAKAKKLDLLLGIELKIDLKPATPLKVDTSVKEFTGYLSYLGGRGSDSPPSSKVGASSGFQRLSSSSWSSRMQLLDAYVQSHSRGGLDSGERRYSNLRLPSSSDGNDYQPATIHGYQIASYLNRIAKEKRYDYEDGQMEALITPKAPSLGTSNYRDPLFFTSRKQQSGLSNMTPPGFSKPIVSRNISLQSARPFNDHCSAVPAAIPNNTVNNAKKFHSLPDISGLSVPYRNSYLLDRNAQWDGPIGYGSSLYANASMKAGAPLAFDDLSPSKTYQESFTSQFSLSSETGSLWSKQPFEKFGVAEKPHGIEGEGAVCKQISLAPESITVMDLEVRLLQSFRHCIRKLLKLEGSDWLFRQNDGADEDLIDRVAAREKFLYEAETREMNQVGHVGESQYSFDRKPGSVPKNDETDHAKFLVSSVPHCGEGCIWRVDLMISFGVWCIHRVLDLSLMESRPELWGKYTYVLNRLQGIIDLAFSKPRTRMIPCFCLQIPEEHQQHRSIPLLPPISNGSLPPGPAKQGSGKFTTAAALLDIIKDVEIAISYRKGRTGTAAGDVAFPKGKENLASVLKRYKRRLLNKPISC
ncbi:Ethylene-insensitive protein 2 [Sarracenia purpurea var. burkii]